MLDKTIQNRRKFLKNSTKILSGAFAFSTLGGNSFLNASESSGASILKCRYADSILNGALSFIMNNETRSLQVEKGAPNAKILNNHRCDRITPERYWIPHYQEAVQHRKQYRNTYYEPLS